MFPEIRISDSIIIPTYLLYLSLLYCFLIFYAVRRAKAHQQSVAITLDLALILMVGGFLGGRLVHIFYEMPFYYAEDWTRVFQFWQGGFVFFGGFLAALAACTVYVYRKNLDFLAWADFYAPIIALGYGLGRVSCFLAGCCYGGACSLRWAVYYPWDFHQIPRHPVQLYAVAWELVAYALLIFLERKKSTPKGRIFFLWLILHGLGRLMMEHFRDDFRGDFILNLSISSWISLFIISAGMSALAVRRAEK